MTNRMQPCSVISFKAMLCYQKEDKTFVFAYCESIKKSKQEYLVGTALGGINYCKSITVKTKNKLSLFTTGQELRIRIDE